MTYNYLKTLRFYIAGALIIMSCATAWSRPQPITPANIEQAVDAIGKFKSKHADAQEIVTCITQNMHDALLAEKLLQPSQQYTGRTYLDLLYQKTTWAQWEQIAPWFKNVEIKAQFLGAYIQHMYNFTKYIPTFDLTQKLIDFLTKNPTCVETLIKMPVHFNAVLSYASPLQQAALESLFSTQKITPENIESFLSITYPASFHEKTTDIIIATLKQNQNALLLEKLIHIPNIYTFYHCANSKQKSLLNNWLEELLLIPEYLEFSIKLKYIWQPYNFSQADHIEKMLGLLQKHPHLLEKLNKQSSALDNIYLNANAKQRTTLQEWAQKTYEEQTGKKLKQSIIQLLLLSNLIPGWAYSTDEWTNTRQTQSKPHFFENATSTLSLLKNASDEMRKTLVAVYKKEQEERAKGNYVFYHAQRWDLHLSADIYKQLWNLTNNDSVGSDFTFFRFNQQTQAFNDRTDYLFMNHALFGNSRRSGSCTVGYFMQNSSIYGATFPAASLCNDFKLSKYYTKYKTDFDQLEQLHTLANTTGNLMLISIPVHKLNFVRPVWPGGSPRSVTVNGTDTRDTKTILDTLITSPKAIVDSDDIEYTMPLTTQYSLDPHNGPRVYSFNAADQEKLKAYEIARDELFAKIKQDLETEKK